MQENTIQSSCARCGICCKKGGPSLHTEDLKLIEKGNIPLKYLFTIRQYEPSFDNIREVIQPASTDIIKIKSKPNQQTCIFFDPDQSGCQIYQERPVECRKLKCWNTTEIIAIYDKNRISRKTILSGVQELRDLVQDHHSRCSYQTIAYLSDQIKNKKKQHEAFQKINSMIQYDNSIRAVLAEKNESLLEITEFLFGRPLAKTIKMFDLPRIE